MANSTASAPVMQSARNGHAKHFQLAVASGAQAPERARAWLRNVSEWMPADAEQTVTLLVSELVTNAVRHGGAGEDDLIQLELRALDGGVSVSVSDPGPGFAPTERDAPLDEPGGWGLVLVDQLAERWGVVRDERTCVWFELATAAG
jgi:anti-sigma regulatory factor (Ser/Thr protein kinase)